MNLIFYCCLGEWYVQPHTNPQEYNKFMNRNKVTWRHGDNNVCAFLRRVIGAMG